MFCGATTRFAIWGNPHTNLENLGFFVSSDDKVTCYAFMQIMQNSFKKKSILTVEVSYIFLIMLELSNVVLDLYIPRIWSSLIDLSPHESWFSSHAGLRHQVVTGIKGRPAIARKLQYAAEVNSTYKNTGWPWKIRRLANNLKTHHCSFSCYIRYLLTYSSYSQSCVSYYYHTSTITIAGLLNNMSSQSTNVESLFSVKGTVAVITGGGSGLGVSSTWPTTVVTKLIPFSFC